MKSSRTRQVWIFVVLAVIGALVGGPVSAQRLRGAIRGFIHDRADKRALQQKVSSTFHELEHDGYQRSYYLYLPSTWDKKTSLPVVFLFHGGGGGARGALYYYELEKKAEEAGFMLVTPNGTGEAKHVLLTWNVSFGFGYAQKNKIDDIGFVNTLLQKLAAEYPIDSKRIFATGLSNGAIFCHFLAAAPGSRFAAIAPVVGTAGGKDPGEKDWHQPPVPQTPVSVCIIQGLVDEHIPIEGGLQKQSVGEPKCVFSASQTINLWVTADGCDPTPETTYNASMNTTTHYYKNGRANSEVVAHVIHDMGHAWPGSTRVPRAGSDKPAANFPGNDIIWKFFQNHPRP
ncbi:MAG TPA: PHB depolymerase family esterase [Candidatus Rifleibacterium sp.]|nr:PHB depolymerase family esterase [Candidatus Rifleibacterium sp.]HPT47628.1 PHB depolymerase family esterase [Candidatus Rifleibacterium sp.]